MLAVAAVVAGVLAQLLVLVALVAEVQVDKVLEAAQVQ